MTSRAFPSKPWPRGILASVTLSLLLAAALLAAALFLAATGAALADPPPWAPAHGWRALDDGGHRYYEKYKTKKRKKHKQTKYKAKKRKKRKHYGGYGDPDLAYAPPIDFARGRCEHEVLGALLGGATGGLIGSQIGKGDGRTAAIIGGSILGLIVGGSIGRSMDEIDQNCVGQALEHAGDGETIRWNSPDDGTSYQVTPQRTYQVSDGRYCREYQTTATVGGRVQETYGKACRQPDGAWQIVQ